MHASNIHWIHISYLTYTGTKGVANALKVITAGAKRDMEKKWFTQLSDKREFHIRCCFILSL